MSSLGDAFGQSLNALSGEKGETWTTTNVKNPALQKLLDASLADYGGVKSSGANALKDYITKYMAGEGAAKTRTTQEIGNLDRYFNGGVANELSAMRNQSYLDALAGNDLASRFYLANANRSRAGQEGGPSSYFSRQALANLAPIQSQAALARDAAARSDWGMLENARMGLTGQRNALDASIAGYGLVPEQVRRQMYGQELGYLGTIGEQDRGNKFYGLEYRPTWGEQVGQHVGDLANAAMQAYSMYTGGGMGGGGGSQPSALQQKMQGISAQGQQGGWGGGPWYGGTSGMLSQPQTSTINAPSMWGGYAAPAATPYYWGTPYSQAPYGTTTQWGPGGFSSVAPSYDYGWGGWGQ